jgi:hypothetical protein
MVGSGRFVGWLAVGTGGRVACAGVYQAKKLYPHEPAGVCISDTQGDLGSFAASPAQGTQLRAVA